MNTPIATKRKLPKFDGKILDIINKGIQLSNPINIMKNDIKKLSNYSFKVKDKIINLSEGKLYIIGWGKVAGAMAEAIESIFGTDIIEDGLIISTSSKYGLKKIRLLKGTHPFASKDNIYATKQVINLAKKCKKNDFVICLISGGGSALLCLPVPEVSLNEKVEATKILVKSGMDVEKINIIRKHLSGIKGGRLAKFIYPATTINLIISDDVCNTINSIASGCTVADPSTFSDALQIINKYGIKDKLPLNVNKYLDTNLDSKSKETLKTNSFIFKKSTYFIIYDNKALLKKLKKLAIEKGFETVEIYPDTFFGDVNEVMTKFCTFVNKVKKRSKSNFLVLAGGEVEIKSSHTGKGGRAQHLAALMIPKLQKFKKKTVFVAAASDGRDFVDGIAGALVNSKTMDDVIRKKINYKRYIEETDTFNLHDKLGTHLFTVEPTQTNVFDVYMFGYKQSE